MAGADDSGLGVSRMNTIIALVSFKLKTSITIVNNMRFHLKRYESVRPSFGVLIIRILLFRVLF